MLENILVTGVLKEISNTNFRDNLPKILSYDANQK